MRTPTAPWWLVAWMALAAPVRHAQPQQQPPACQATPDAPYGGAYRTPRGALMSVVPAGTDGRWRITHLDSGRSHRLHPAGASRFQSGDDLESGAPVAYRYAFRSGPGGRVEWLVIDGPAATRTVARRVALVDRPAVFRNGDVELHGRLTLPAGGATPRRAVVFVHGSDPVPSVGLEWLPHLLASHGIATLVFDKRGTGCSKGEYLQHVGLLADDVVAAVRWLQAQSGIDAKRIGLAGFSQGGWVAPLAALKEPSIRYVAVGYGLAMSMADEDRLEAPLKLKEAGVDDASVAEFEELNASLHTLARSGFQDWSDFERRLEHARGRPWFALASRQQSWLGVTMQMGLEQAKQVAPGMFQHFFQPFYDPAPTLERLGIPMLWLMAGRDVEAPPQPTLDVLARLRAHGQPVTVVVYPNADHGLQDFVVRDGRRVRTRYADGYFQTLRRWLQDPK